MKRTIILALALMCLPIFARGQQNQNNFNGSSSGLPTGLSFTDPTLTVSTAGSGNGALALSGNTSGAATITAPAVAGTSTNPMTFSNGILVPDGGAASGTEAIQFTACPGCGVWASSSFGIQMAGGASTGVVQIDSLGIAPLRVMLGSNGGLLFSSNSGITSIGQDTGLFRSAAGVLAVGNGTASDTTAKVKAAGYMSAGTTFTSNAGCTESALAGGATAGKFSAGTTACTIVITMGNTATAPNGWSCSVWDTTTTADTLKETTFSTTTVTFSGTVAVNDVIIFNCMGF